MRRHANGFTLIEVLVVVVLVAIITTLAAINIGPQDNQAQREARRLAAVLQVASRTAVIEARELGLVLDADGYRFTRLDDGAWQGEAFEQDRSLGSYTLPAGVELDLRTEALPGARAPGAEDEDDGDERPHILILSSGELSPFEIEVRTGDARARSWFVTGALDGSIDYHEANSEP